MSVRQSVRWASTPPVGANDLSYQLPSFQFNCDDVNSGAVKVLAQSPSGRRQQMELQEVDGMYNANFTPNECGDWTISVLHEDQNIEGSPFKVRVYDPGQIRVFGLNGGVVGRDCSFTVDTSGAGEGQLTIDILYNGQTVAANIQRDSTNGAGFKVHFVPIGAGFYNIRIQFADIDVPGSPFTVEIVDPSAGASASGSGLCATQVRQRTNFIVCTGIENCGTDLRVTISDPRGMQVPAVIRGNNAGSCVIEYVPVVVGEHQIDVIFFGKPIQGSPFICNVTDWSKIFLSNLRNSTTVGKKVEFDIDASQAGPGELEISVNDGTVQCTVQSTGNKKFRASFIPREPGPHRICLRFNGEDVPAGPWVVDVRCAVQATVNFAGMQMVTVNRPAAFEVRTGSADDGKIVINVTSPSGRLVRCNVSKKGNGVYKVEYIPNEVGNYTIEVIYDGAVVAGSPFISKACDGSAIKVSPIPPGEVGNPVEFTIDAIKAGEGQLEITVEHGAIPNSAQMMSKGIFKVSFVPKEAKLHLVEIRFNCKLINGGSIMVPVIDLSQITVQGDCSRLVPVNRPCLLKISTQLAGEGDLVIRIVSPSSRDVPGRITGSSKKKKVPTATLR